eukprot:m.169608 g.169608  ORF g.169608 m.169608 type:complete len:207 (-) comp17810_c0_seq2:224-844(-)
MSAPDNQVAKAGPVNPYQELRKEMLVEPSPTSEATAIMANVHQTRKMYDPTDLVQLAQYVQTADNTTRGVVGGKLQLISQQIQMLQEQARMVLNEAKRDVELNHARCNFQRKAGRIYHLYEKLDVAKPFTYWGMLSPEEWGVPRPSERFLGSYRLEFDSSWTPVADIQRRDDSRMLDADLLGLNREHGRSAQKQQLSLEFIENNSS